MKMRAAVLLLCAAGISCNGVSALSLIPDLSCSDLMDMSVAPVPEIRIVVLYSAKAAAATVDIEGEIRHSVLEANAVFARSDIPLRLALAHMESITLTNEAAVLTLVEDMINGVSPLQVAQTLRDRYHADIVALVPEAGAGAAIPMLVPGMKFSDSAYVVVGRYVMMSNLTLPHEIAHILGSNHHRDETSPAKLPAYRYAFPKRCPTCGWRTIMAAPDLFLTVRIWHFSNPDVLYYDPGIPADPGNPTGEPITVAQPEDNRRALTNTGPIVSYFRMTPAWFASAGGASPWFDKRATDETMSQVRFADLDGDKSADAFMIDDTGAWLISRSASGPWEPWRGVDPLTAPLEQLRFADFNGDGIDDVFYVDVGGGRWVVSHGGTTAWQTLNTSTGIMGFAVTDLAFGEFDGNPGADVFRSDAVNGAWYYSSGGQSGWTSLGLPDASRKIPTSQLRIGDFNADGTSDVFQSDIPAETWRWSRSGVGPWQVLLHDAETAVPVSGLLFGDFDGDKFTDVLKPTGQAWGVSWKGTAAPVLLKLSCAKVNDVALGDFDGDGTTDVIRAGIRP